METEFAHQATPAPASGLLTVVSDLVMEAHAELMDVLNDIKRAGMRVLRVMKLLRDAQTAIEVQRKLAAA